MEDERQQRWAISPSETDRIEHLKSDDELVGTWQDTDDDGHPVGDTHSVVVLRDGTVTNRYSDGTIGVPALVRDHLESEDSLYHPGPGGAMEQTENWRDVVVARDGSFLRLAEPAPQP